MVLKGAQELGAGWFALLVLCFGSKQSFRMELQYSRLWLVVVAGCAHGVLVKMSNLCHHLLYPLGEQESLAFSSWVCQNKVINLLVRSHLYCEEEKKMKSTISNGFVLLPLCAFL